MTTTKKSSNTLYIAIAVIVIVIIVAGVLAYVYTRPTSTTPSGNHVDIYAGDTPTYGFGNSANSITSPGPALTFTAGETVTVTLHNSGPSGTMPHNFAIVDQKSSTGNVLWGSQIHSTSDPVNPGSSASKTFTVGSAGNYYYICQIDGHVTLGMWGIVTVTS